MAWMMSPARRPAPSAGEPGNGGDDDEAAVGREGRAGRRGALAIDGADRRADPLELARDRAQLSLNSSLVRYSEYGSSSAPIMPLIAPSMSALRSMSPPA